MTQTIARLTPLSYVQKLIAAEVQAVAATDAALVDAAGSVPAEDVVAAAQPAQPIALADGWAVRSDETLGAGGYTPAPLANAPQRIDAGEPMPINCDCIAPFDAVRVTNGQAEALAEIAPGEGVLPAAGDHDGAGPLAKAGVRLNAAHAAALAALGVSHIPVCRPRVALACVRPDAILQAEGKFRARDAQAQARKAQKR